MSKFMVNEKVRFVIQGSLFVRPVSPVQVKTGTIIGIEPNSDNKDKYLIRDSNKKTHLVYEINIFKIHDENQLADSVRSLERTLSSKTRETNTLRLELAVEERKNRELRVWIVMLIAVLVIALAGLFISQAVIMGTLK